MGAVPALPGGYIMTDIEHPDFYHTQYLRDAGGNTPERVEEQIEWLKKVAESEE